MTRYGIYRGRPCLTLENGHLVRGQYPGASAVVHAEHLLRDQLALEVRGLTEASLPFGRADIITPDSVFEVESLKTWRKGAHQVLAYHAQTGFTPTLALFGAASRDEILKIFLKLRDGFPRIHLWWHDGYGWQQINARRDCRTMREPNLELVRQRIESTFRQRQAALEDRF